MTKVLIIEDEVQLVDVYSFMLQHKGYTVDSANNGEEGLVKARTFKPNIILLDMMMPKLGGLGFLERYKAGKPKHVKIMIMSNMQTKEHQEKAFELGAERYEIKALLTPSQLLAIVDEMAQ